MYLIRQLSYGVVTEEVDRVIAAKGNLAELREVLAKRAREANEAPAPPGHPVMANCDEPDPSDD